MNYEELLKSPLNETTSFDPLNSIADLSGVGRVEVDPRKAKRRLLTRMESKQDEYILALDNSSLEKFNTCERSGEYYLVKRRYTPGSTALRFGGALHEALEAYYTGKGSEGPERIAKYYADNPVAYDDWRTLDLCIQAYQRYQVQYPLSNEPFTIPEIDGRLAVELPFRVPYGFIEVDDTFKFPAHQLVEDEESDEHLYVKKIHFMWQGKIDMVVVDPNGVWWVLDHKTTSIAGQTFSTQFQLSQQMFGYVNASQMFLGHPIRGLFLNGIVTRIPTKTGKGFDYIRERFPYDEEQLIEHRSDISHIVDGFIRCLTEGYFPRKTAWCVGKYGTCPYHKVCTIGNDKDRNLVLQSELYNPVTWSPLD